MSKIEVACYHWSNWHPNPANDERLGKNWTEWEYLKRAIPRFPGHQQPKHPIWGYLDDSKQEVIDHQITEASDHGIDAFIFDWGYPSSSCTVCVERFMSSAYCDRMKFGLMACGMPQTYEGMQEMADYVIENYFSHPSYWKVDGGCYFSVYEIGKHVRHWGGIAEAKRIIQMFRDKCAAKGLKLHFVAVEWGLQFFNTHELDAQEIVRELGVDAITSYTWAHNTLPAWPVGDYEEWAESAYKEMRNIEEKYPVPYYSHVSMGWDNSPRCPEDMTFYEGGPLMYHNLITGGYDILHEPYWFTIIRGNTPAAFRRALLAAKRHTEEGKYENKIVTLYAWNEWTEGAYLEPDSVNGYGYLNAIKDVFAKEN